MRHTPPRFQTVPSFLSIGLILLLAGCGGDDITRSFGLARDAPDEFTVTTRAPLAMPPDFALRAPRPGAARPQEQSARAAAEATLVPAAALATAGQAGATSATPGQVALLQAAGPAAPADIRSRVDQESSLERPPRDLVDRLMFWRKSNIPAGVSVDPQREAQRLRENAALGQSVRDGDTPIIQPRARSFIDRFF